MSRLFLSPPHLGTEERHLLLDALDSNWIAPVGPHLDAFEAEMAHRLGSGSVVALSSGTAALHLALTLLGVGPGDVVVTSTLTFVATANAVRYCGATPLFVDSDPETWTMSPDLLDALLADCAKSGGLPKVVLVADLYGQCADYTRIQETCDRYEVSLVSDAAESLGATHAGRPAGTFGALAALSFNGNKIITAGGGGMLWSSRLDWTEKARYLATQAREPLPHYEHHAVGYNYRLSNLLAAVGRGQLRLLDERVAQRRAIREAYRSAFAYTPGVTLMPESSLGRSSHWLTAVTIEPSKTNTDAEHVRRALEAHDIESRPTWKPMHLQPIYADCPRRGGAVAERIFETGLCLPSGSAMTQVDIDRVVDVIHEHIASRA